MIKISINFESFYLQRTIKVDIALPYPSLSNESVVNVWCMHCALKDGSFFFDSLGIAKYVDKYKVAVICPSISSDVSFCKDNSLVLDFLENELKEWLSVNLNLSNDPSKNILLGISMGAYRSLKWAISSPKTFSKVSLISGVYDFNLFDPKIIKQDRQQFMLYKLILPNIKSNLLHKDSNEIYSGNLIEKVVNSSPDSFSQSSFHIYCGSQDFLSLNQSEALNKSLLSNGISSKLNVSDGKHEVSYWEISISDFMKNLLEQQ